MEIADLLTPERVILDIRSRNKTQLFGDIARQCGRLVPAVRPDAVEAALLAREQLGSTGLGAGFALPHARIEGLDSYIGLFVRLAKPIDFDAIDGKPVRLVFTLLIPSNGPSSHVTALATISRCFRDPDLSTKIGLAATQVAAYGFLTNN